MFRKIDDSISVAGQITPDDVQAAAEQGFAAIINNRPDGEETGQPAAADIEAAAHEAGLAYFAIPISHAGFSTDQVEAMADALAAAPGPVLAFCRSGTRSTFAWALASATRGVDADTLISKAAGAGYDLSPIAAHLRG